MPLILITHRRDGYNMKKLLTIVFAIQLMVNTIVIYFVLLIKQIKFLYLMFGFALAFQIVGIFILALIANSKRPFIYIKNQKWLSLLPEGAPKGGKK